MTSVSVILTVYNEASSIEAVLRSLAEQTRRPAEIVIVDGGSHDGTVAAIDAFGRTQPGVVLADEAEDVRPPEGTIVLRCLQRPGANISQGRNSAIAAARNDVIAVTDAGVRLASDWLAAIIAPFESDPTLQVVAGFFEADPQTPFEVALGVTTLPTLSEIDPATFLPSSRSVAFRRAAWQRAGGYPEWLDYCEDLILDINLKSQNGRFGWAPSAIAHFRPRPSLRAFYRQYYRYARGDGKAALWTRRHIIRYGTYFGGLPLGVLLGWRWRWGWLLLFAGTMVYLRTPYRRLWQGLREGTYQLSPVQLLGVISLVPIIRAVGDFAKMLGYPAGLAWRWRKKPPNWHQS